jgi:hypothetical protein
MKMQFMAAAVLALLSLGACSADPQVAAANQSLWTRPPWPAMAMSCRPWRRRCCVGVATQDPAPCPNLTGSNAITALWSALTGGPSAAQQASVSATRPSG